MQLLQWHEHTALGEECNYTITRRGLNWQIEQHLGETRLKTTWRTNQTDAKNLAQQWENTYGDSTHRDRNSRLRVAARNTRATRHKLVAPKTPTPKTPIPRPGT